MLKSFSTEVLLANLRGQESLIRYSDDAVTRKLAEVFAIDLRNELLSRGLTEEQVYPDWVYA